MFSIWLVKFLNNLKFQYHSNYAYIKIQYVFYRMSRRQNHSELLTLCISKAKHVRDYLCLYEKTLSIFNHGFNN